MGRGTGRGEGGRGKETGWVGGEGNREGGGRRRLAGWVVRGTGRGEGEGDWLAGWCEEQGGGGEERGWGGDWLGGWCGEQGGGGEGKETGWVGGAENRGGGGERRLAGWVVRGTGRVGRGRGMAGWRKGRGEERARVVPVSSTLEADAPTAMPQRRFSPVRKMKTILRGGWSCLQSLVTPSCLWEKCLQTNKKKKKKGQHPRRIWLPVSSQGEGIARVEGVDGGREGRGGGGARRGRASCPRRYIRGMPLLQSGPNEAHHQAESRRSCLAVRGEMVE